MAIAALLDEITVTLRSQPDTRYVQLSCAGLPGGRAASVARPGLLPSRLNAPSVIVPAVGITALPNDTWTVIALAEQVSTKAEEKLPPAVTVGIGLVQEKLSPLGGENASVASPPGGPAKGSDTNTRPDGSVSSDDAAITLRTAWMA